MRGLRGKRVIVCLVVGAAATWLSAWGLMLSRIGDTTSAEFVDRWPVPVSDDWPSPMQTTRITSLGLRVEVTAADRTGPLTGGGNGTEQWAYWRLRLGWPALALDSSLRGSSATNLATGVAVKRDYETQGLLEYRFRSRDYAIPVLPVWPGFLINTLFYAGACWLLLAAPGGVRRWRRTRRGQCPACGYDLSGVEVCPECGTRDGAITSPERQ